MRLKFHVGGMAYFSKEGIPKAKLARLRRLLTVHPKGYQGNVPEPVPQYVENDAFFGVPRQYYRERIEGSRTETVYTTTDGNRELYAPVGSFGAKLRQHQRVPFQRVMQELRQDTSLGGVLRAPTGFGKCVSGDTLIATASGLVPIAELVGSTVKDLAVDIHVVAVAAGSDPYVATRGLYTGDHAPWHLVTESGARLRSTSEHPVWCKRGEGPPEFVVAEEVREGDWVALRAFPFPTRSEVSPEECAIAGYINAGAEPVGDFSQELRDKVSRSCARGVFYTPVLSATREGVCEYLRAYFDTLGEVYEDGIDLEGDALLLSRVRLLLQGFGIRAWHGLCGESEVLHLHSSAAPLFAAEIGFVSPEQKGRLDVLLGSLPLVTMAEPIPCASYIADLATSTGDESLQRLTILSSSDAVTLEAAVEALRRVEELGGPPRDRRGRVAHILLQEMVREVSEAEVLWDVVSESRKGSDPIPMYDITVPGRHWFVGDGFQCHNTVLSCAVIAELDRPTVVLVHNEMLRDQWMERLGEFLPDAALGTVQQDTWDYENKSVVVAMSPTLAARDEIPDAFKSWPGLLIADEVHRYGARSWSKVLSLFPARLRLGVSATPQRNDGCEEIFYNHIGKLIYYVEQEQVEPTVYMLNTGYSIPDSKNVDPETVPEWLALRFMIHDKERNARIAGWVREAVKNGRNPIVLTARRAHVNILEEAITAAFDEEKITNCTVGVCVGGVRGEALEESRQATVLIGTYKYVAEAFDVPRLDTLIFATPKVSVEQAVGRVTREPKEGEEKKDVLVLDPVDESIGVFRAYAAKRRRYYAERGYLAEQKREGGDDG